MHAPLANSDSIRAISDNIRRLMAREGLTFDQLVESAELDERTIRGVLRGTNKPHARTLHKLASGFGVPVDELFRAPQGTQPGRFDRATNPVVEQVVADHPELFRDWCEADFDELASHFGTGGELTEAGALAVAERINHKRAVWQQMSVVLETDQGGLLCDFVELLYRRVTEGVSPCAEGQDG